LKAINYTFSSTNYHPSDDTNRAIDIMNEHLKMGPTYHDRDALACQEKLLEAGLKQYAKS